MPDSQRHDHSKGPRHVSYAPLKVLEDPLWEKQRGEGQAAYNWFRAYRDSPRRTFKGVAEIYEVDHGAISRCAKAKLWEERALAYDRWLDTRSLAVTEGAVRNEAAKTQERIRTLIDAEWEIGEAAREKIRQLLAADIDPKTAARDAAGLIREATRMARLSVGLNTEGGRPSPGDDKVRGADIDAFLASLEGDPDKVKSEVKTGGSDGKS